MQTIVMLHFIVVLLFQNGFAQECPNVGLSPAIRSALVVQHNQLRSNLAKGLESTVGGKNASPGKNIYKLNYDCGLESQTQQWADQCTFQHSSSALRNASENLFWAWGNDISAATTIPKAISWWWNELALNGIIDPQNRLTLDVFRDGVGHFTAMAWGASTKVGCGFGRNCKYNGISVGYVVCQYRITGNILNAVIYELGQPCNADADCTTYGSSKCSKNEGLCYVDRIETTKSPQEAASNSTTHPKMLPSCNSTYEL